MKLWNVFLAAWLWCAAAHADDALRWAVYYGAKESWESFKQYDTIVFDADRHPQVRPLAGMGKDVLAYLSLVEADRARPYYNRLRQKGLLMEEAEKKPGVVDIRKPEWTAFVIEELVPQYVRQGFTGLMFDTVDTAAALEAKDPGRYAGMSDAATRVIRHVRLHYPYLTLMMNRGFDILPSVDGDLDMVLAESIYIDSRNLPARPFPPSHYQSVLKTLADARVRNPRLRTFSLDYWDMADGEGVKRIYRQQRKEGLAPYVATHDLQTLYGEP